MLEQAPDFRHALLFWRRSWARSGLRTMFWARSAVHPYGQRFQFLLTADFCAQVSSMFVVWFRAGRAREGRDLGLRFAHG